MVAGPTMLRLRLSRGILRRAVFLGALPAMLAAAPNAGGVPGDPSPPEITPSVVGTPGAAGWFRSNVTVSWTVVDPESIILSTSGCDTRTLTTDTPGLRLSCSASSDGGETTKSLTIRLDRTPPAAGGAFDRPPDANGWYNRPLTVVASGTDATSGLDSCASASYAGPDNPNAAVTVSCRDIAGNAAATAIAFKYDATAPTLAAIRTRAGNRSVEVGWRSSPDTRLIEVVRAPGRGRAATTVVYRGTAAGFRDVRLRVGRRYRYRVAAFDEAMNSAAQTRDVVATGALLSPAPAQRIRMSSPPTLLWTPVRRAAYYNVQLIRGGKVLSAWPVRTRYRLRRTWLYKGRRYRLQPGRYRWYVWPGYGAISQARYGARLGSSTFVITR